MGLSSLVRRLPLHLAILAIVVVWSIPTAALLVSSFRYPSTIGTTGWWTALTPPFDWSLENYRAVLTQRNMAQAFANSLLISVPSTVLSVFVAALAAYAFAWMRFPGRKAPFLVVVALLVVPLQMTLIPILRLYTSWTIDVPLPLVGGRAFGTGSFPGMWVAHTAYGLPSAVFLLRNFFGSLPRDLIDSAHLDGAGELRVFFRIVLPLSKPALVLTGVSTR